MLVGQDRKAGRRTSSLEVIRRLARLTNSDWCPMVSYSEQFVLYWNPVCKTSIRNHRLFVDLS